MAMHPASEALLMASLPTTLWYCSGSCQLGQLLLAEADHKLHAILLGDDAQELIDDLHKRFPKTELKPASAQQRRHLQRVLDYVDKPRGAFPLDKPLAMHGTDFQRTVWQALSKVPAGKTVSYSDLAKRIGKPRSARAVAGACAANPLAIAVPCHRVLRSDGGISGYRWGVDRKRKLLELEDQLNN